MRRTRIERHGLQRRDAGGEDRQRIARPVGVGDVTLDARHRDAPENEPRRPILMLSPTRAVALGSPTMAKS